MVARHGRSNHRSTDTTSAPKRSLARHKHIGDILILTQKRQVQNDLQRLSISSHDNELGDTTVQRLGGLVGALAELLVVTGLLDEVEDGVGEGGVGEGGCFLVGLQRHAADNCIQHREYEAGPAEEPVTYTRADEAPQNPLVHHSKRREGRTIVLVRGEIREF